MPKPTSRQTIMIMSVQSAMAVADPVRPVDPDRPEGGVDDPVQGEHVARDDPDDRNGQDEREERGRSGRSSSRAPVRTGGRPRSPRSRAARAPRAGVAPSAWRRPGTWGRRRSARSSGSRPRARCSRDETERVVEDPGDRVREDEPDQAQRREHVQVRHPGTSLQQAVGPVRRVSRRPWGCSRREAASRSRR